MFADIRYRKNFLKNVIARVDFTSPIKGLDVQLPAEISKGVLKYFPIAESKRTIARELQISPDKLKQKKSEFMEWKFFGKDRKKTLTIVPTAVFVEYSSYATYELWREEFLGILSVFFDTYQDAVCSRLGIVQISFCKI